MLKLKTNQVFKEFDGRDLKDATGKSIEVGMLLGNAISGVGCSNPSLGWVLGKKLATEKEVELKAEEVVFLKGEVDRVSKGDKAWLSGLMAGQLIEILDGKEEKKK